MVCEGDSIPSTSLKKKSTDAFLSIFEHSCWPATHTRRYCFVNMLQDEKYNRGKRVLQKFG